MIDSGTSASNTPGKTPAQLPGTDAQTLFSTKYEVEEVDEKEEVPVQH